MLQTPLLTRKLFLISVAPATIKIGLLEDSTDPRVTMPSNSPNYIYAPVKKVMAEKRPSEDSGINLMQSNKSCEFIGN